MGRRPDRGTSPAPAGWVGRRLRRDRVLDDLLLGDRLLTDLCRRRVVTEQRVDLVDRHERDLGPLPQRLQQRPDVAENRLVLLVAQGLAQLPHD